MALLDECKIINLPNLGDIRGNLCVVEGGKTIPFEIARVFYMFGTDQNSIRGQHANKNSAFVMICLAGSCKVEITDGVRTTVVELDSPLKALYVPKLLWKNMYDFSSDSALLVMSNTHYDGKEYLRDFEEYKSFMKGETND